MTAPKQVTDQRDMALGDGTPAFLYSWRTDAGLGEPYGGAWVQVIFPTGEDSIGSVSFMAHVEEQKQVQQKLLDEVLAHVEVG